MDRNAEIISSRLLLLRSGRLKDVFQLYLLYGRMLLEVSFQLLAI